MGLPIIVIGLNSELIAFLFVVVFFFFVSLVLTYFPVSDFILRLCYSHGDEG